MTTYHGSVCPCPIALPPLVPMWYVCFAPDVTKVYSNATSGLVVHAIHTGILSISLAK